MSCDEEFDVGDAVVLEVTWLAAGVPADATTVLSVRDPAGVLVEYSGAAVVAMSTGRYRVALPAVQTPGRWFYRFVASGALVAAEEGSFYVRASRVL